MFLKWIAGLLLLGTLAAQVQAEEKDAPLPFDEPGAAPQLVKKAAPAARIKVSNQTLVRTSPRAASSKKRVTRSVVRRSAKAVPKKMAVSKKVVVSKKVPVTRRAVQKPAVKKSVSSASRKQKTRR